MKLEELQVDEGFREKALSGILSLGLAFASQVDAAEVYVYTDDDGAQQVVATYKEIPKGKIAYVIDVEDMDVKTIQTKEVRAGRDISDETRKRMYRTDI